MDQPGSNREGETSNWRYRAVPDPDSTDIPVYGEQEQNAYNEHFEATCYGPLLLFDREGDRLAAKPRPGNVHSAEGWEELLLPEIERQQRMGKEAAFRAEAAFAKPEVSRPGDARSAAGPNARARPARFRSRAGRSCACFGLLGVKKEIPVDSKIDE